MIDIRKVNRNFFVLPDFDRDNPQDSPKPNIERLKDELDGNEKWPLETTAGRTIEILVPLETLKKRSKWVVKLCKKIVIAGS